MMQWLQKPRYLIVEVVGDPFGTFYGHAGVSALPEIGIGGEQREHDDDHPKRHLTKMAAEGSWLVNF
jgi:hypothetical protein